MSSNVKGTLYLFFVKVMAAKINRQEDLIQDMESRVKAELPLILVNDESKYHQRIR